MENKTIKSLTHDILERIEFRDAVKTAVSGCLGWVLGLWLAGVTDRPDRLVSGLWCTVSAIVVIQSNLGGTYKAALMRFLGVVIGSALGGFFTTFLGSNPFSLALSVFCTIIFCSALNLKDSIRMACLSVSVVMILWGFDRSLSPWIFSFYRALDSTIGIIIAVFVAHALWPSQAVHKMRMTLCDVFKKLEQLYQIMTHLSANLINQEEAVIDIKNEVSNQLSMVDGFLKEAQMELLYRHGTLEEWTYLNEKTKRLGHLISVLEKEYLVSQKMLDEPLAQQLASMIRQTDKTLRDLSLLIQQDQEEYSLQALLETQAQLNADLVRFRSTRALRQWDIAEVESFYIFFSCCDSIVEILQQMIETIKQVNEER